MKFNNPIVVFDLETFDDPDNRRIIEIGAVALDKNLEVIAAYSNYVNPGESGPSHRVTELTGIHACMLSDKNNWSFVSDEIEGWAECYFGNIKKCRLAAWGNYFDVNVLRDEYKRVGREYPWSGTCIDVKSIALLWAALSGRRTDSLSVGKCMEMMGLTPVGPYHRAYIDAEATSQILRRAVSEIAGGVWLDKQYIRVGK